MFQERIPARRRDGRPSFRPVRPTCEPLEQRTVAAAGVTAPILGTITGQVANYSSQVGIGHVKIELINAKGKVEQSTYTNASGNYAFNMTNDAPYVVHEVVPKGYKQAAPNFATSAPVGSYDPGAGNNSWNYVSTNTNPQVGPVGPAYWSDIAPAGNEPFESPIDIGQKTVDLKSVLSVNFSPAVPSAIINNSHQIQVQFTNPAADYIVAGGIRSNLAQFHYHDPSETTVAGKTYAMEEHFVLLSLTGAESVVAVFLRVGKHNSSLDPVLDAAEAKLTAPNSKTTISTPVDFSGLLPRNSTGWFYRGSLTTPPLSQAVNWFVYKTPITLDSAQLGEYESVASQGGFFPNARPIQPLDGRTLNQIDNNVNFTGTDVGGQSFALLP